MLVSMSSYAVITLTNQPSLAFNKWNHPTNGSLDAERKVFEIPNNRQVLQTISAQ